MDYLLIISGLILIIFGIVGSVVPVLPGPPLSYIGLLLLHFTEKHHFSERFLMTWLTITVVVTIIDYLVPVWGTKKFGGSRLGIWGSILGLIAGLVFFPPAGIIIGPFAGAVLGEILAGKNSSTALKSGFGSFIGFLFGTLLKLIVSGLMAWHFGKELFLG